MFFGTLQHSLQHTKTPVNGLEHSILEQETKINAFRVVPILMAVSEMPPILTKMLATVSAST